MGTGGYRRRRSHPSDRENSSKSKKEAKPLWKTIQRQKDHSKKKGKGSRGGGRGKNRKGSKKNLSADPRADLQGGAGSRTFKKTGAECWLFESSWGKKLRPAGWMEEETAATGGKKKKFQKRETCPRKHKSGEGTIARAGGPDNSQGGVRRRKPYRSHETKSSYWDKRYLDELFILTKLGQKRGGNKDRIPFRRGGAGSGPKPELQDPACFRKNGEWVQ